MTNLSFPLDTTTINVGLLGDLASHGFEDDLPCTLSVYTNPNSAPPIVRFRNDPVTPLELEASLWIAFHCQKTKSSKL